MKEKDDAWETGCKGAVLWKYQECAKKMRQTMRIKKEQQAHKSTTRLACVVPPVRFVSHMRDH